MSCDASWVWADTQLPYTGSACCSSCHEDKYLGYAEMIEQECPEGTPYSWEYRGSFYVSACCAVGILVDNGKLIAAPPLTDEDEDD